MQSKRNTVLAPNRTCEICGAAFHAKPSIIALGYGRFCSIDCSGLQHRTTTTATCQTCGADFALKVHKARDPHRGKFCSKPCYYIGRRSLRQPLADRLWSKVDRSGGPDACWLWHETGKGSKGYGKIGTGGRDGQEINASKAAWIVTHGPVPDGLWVLHNCPTGDNPACCNPAHLWLGTPAENTADMMRKSRHFTQHTLPHT